MTEDFNIAARSLNDTERLLLDLKLTYRKKPDGTYEAVGDVDLGARGLTKLPDLSNVSLTGSFICSGNALTSLKGAPRTVGENFDCRENLLETLEGSPVWVRGNFCASLNRLMTLEGGPRFVDGGYYCNGNSLASLKGAPQLCAQFDASDNNLTTLEGGPKEVGKNFWCDNNRLTSLEHGPLKVDELYSCRNNQLETLQGAPSHAHIFTCTENRLTRFRHAPERFWQIRTDAGVYGLSTFRVVLEYEERKDQEAAARDAFAREIAEAAVAQNPVTVGKPLTLRRSA